MPHCVMQAASDCTPQKGHKGTKDPRTGLYHKYKRSTQGKRGFRGTEHRVAQRGYTG